MEEFQRIMNFQLEDRFNQGIDRLSTVVLSIPPKKNETEALQELRKLISIASDLAVQTGKPWFSYCLATKLISSTPLFIGLYKCYVTLQGKEGEISYAFNV